jgi:hypothetical protein
MANMPAADYAVSRAHNFPSLATGVHLNICQGRPILPASEVHTLVGAGGAFYPPREAARRLWMQRAAPAEIEREFRAQIRWMKERGLAPSHADSHHHMHLYPAAAGPFARALAAEGIRCARSCLCAEWPKNKAIGGPYGGRLLRRIFVGLYRNGMQRTVFRRLESPGSRIAISLSDGGASVALRERWKAALETLPLGTFELACHPGLFEAGFSETDSICARREDELQCVTDRDLRDVIERRAIRLISYRDLRSRPPCDGEAAAEAA